MGEGGHYDKPSDDQKHLYLQHFPGGSDDWAPLVVEKVGEENIGEQPGRFRRGLAEGISPTEKSVAMVRLAQGVAGSQESGELSVTETHHGDVILQQLHCLIESPAGSSSMTSSSSPPVCGLT